MVNRPSIVLADEPTGNLDTAATKVIMAALREIHEAGNTIVMVTHNPDLAAYGDRVIKMLDGKIVEEFTGSAIKKELDEQRKDASEIAQTAKITIRQTKPRSTAKKRISKAKPKAKPKSQGKPKTVRKSTKGAKK